MKKEAFNLGVWRSGLIKRTSKAKAARMLGLDPHTYNKYEEEGFCPTYIKLATMAIARIEEQIKIQGYKP